MSAAPGSWLCRCAGCDADECRAGVRRPGARGPAPALCWWRVSSRRAVRCVACGGPGFPRAARVTVVYPKRDSGELKRAREADQAAKRAAKANTRAQWRLKEARAELDEAEKPLAGGVAATEEEYADDAPGGEPALLYAAEVNKVKAQARKAATREARAMRRLDRAKEEADDAATNLDKANAKAEKAWTAQNGTNEPGLPKRSPAGGVPWSKEAGRDRRRRIMLTQAAFETTN